MKRKAGKPSKKEAEKKPWASGILAMVRPTPVINLCWRGLVSLEKWLEARPVYALPVMLFLGLMVYALAIPQSTILDPDSGWLMRTGELILQNASLPAKDVFSFTQGDHPWILYQWLFEVYLGLLHRLAGLGGVIWGTALMIALTYALLLSFLIRGGLTCLVSIALVILTMMVTQFYWYARPNTFTLLAFMVLLLRLEGYRCSHRGCLWDLPLLFLLWANIHLGFLSVWGWCCSMGYGPGWRRGLSGGPRGAIAASY